jgi:preprotein translocase subunit SecA
MVTRQIRSAQTQIEGQNAEIRKNVLKYDEVLNKQRQVVYAERRRVLDGEDMHDQIKTMIDDVVGDYVLAETSTGYAEDWDLEQLWTNLRRLYPVALTIDDIVEEAGGERNTIDPEFLTQQVKDDAAAAYATREEELGSDALRELERQVLLAVIDRKWREHLYEMDYLEGQVEEAPTVTVDPSKAVPLPAGGVMTGNDNATESDRVGVRAKGLGGSRRPQNLQYTAPAIDGEAGAGSPVIQQPQAPALGIGPGGSPVPPSPAHTSGARRGGGQAAESNGPSRNAPCYCGSGKKYKRCHGAPGAA